MGETAKHSLLQWFQSHETMEALAEEIKIYKNDFIKINKFVPVGFLIKLL